MTLTAKRYELTIQLLEDRLKLSQLNNEILEKKLKSAYAVETDQNKLIDALIGKINYLEGRLSVLEDMVSEGDDDEGFGRVIFRRFR